MAGSFAQHYGALADDELLQLALERQDMVAAASAALDAELARRGLREDALQSFRDRLLAENAPEEIAQGEPLPPPMELPEDWFDEKADATPRSVSVLRPKGVTVIALLFWSGGTISIAMGAVLSRQHVVTGALEFALGVAVLLTGVGLWRLRPWARKTAVGLLWGTSALSAAVILITAIATLQGTPVSNDEQVILFFQFWTMLLRVVFALYLGSNSARRAFQRTQVHRHVGLPNGF